MTGISESYQTLLADALGLANLRQRSAALWGDEEKGAQVFDTLYAELATLWCKAVESPSFRPSRENFRWFKPQLGISPANASPEVTLERALVAAACRRERQDWANQIPIVSGIGGSRAGKRQAIDLVRMSSANELEFVELKVRSDSPLFAAAEISLYGLLWLCARRDKNRILMPPSPLLGAKSLKLSVLAPRQFYRGCDAAEISRFFNVGLSTLGDRHHVEMSFALTAFPDDFSWPMAADDSWLLRQLDERLIV